MLDRFFGPSSPAVARFGGHRPSIWQYTVGGADFDITPDNPRTGFTIRSGGTSDNLRCWQAGGQDWKAEAEQEAAEAAEQDNDPQWLPDAGYRY